jgi:hypothetical protein
MIEFSLLQENILLVSEEQENIGYLSTLMKLVEWPYVSEKKEKRKRKKKKRKKKKEKRSW